MKRLAVLCFLSVLALYNCDNSSSDDGVTIQGTVTDESSGDALVGAAIIITDPVEFDGTFESTDSSGAYSFENLDISDPTDFTLQASVSEYETDVKTITTLPGQSYNLDFELDEESADDGGTDGDTDDDDLVVEGELGVPATIILNSVSETDINIRQTGGIVNSVFSFAIQDSSGRNMNADSPVVVSFRILNGPGGGETVVPSSAETDANGIVTTSLFSGDSAGVVRVEAFFEREDGARVSSSPVIVAINGGFPHPDHFFVGPEKYNIEGFGVIGPNLPYTLTASVGDQFGNPVRTGTSVDFRSLEAGIISGSAQTNEQGFASVTFYPNGSRPTTHPSGTGWFTVRAHTFDQNNNDLYTDVDILFTTQNAIITFIDTSFTVPPNGTDIVRFTVRDENGYPMAAGTRITATVGGSAAVAGDSDIELGDYFLGGPGITEFSVSISDTDDEDDTQVETTLTVNVTTPSGVKSIRSINGLKAKVIGN